MNLKFRNLFQKDIDQVFSYRTGIEVVILDRYVGIIYRLLQLLMITYYLYINFSGKSEIIKQDYSKGISLVEIAGTGLSTADAGDLFYDELDIVEPEAHSDSIFLATSIRVSTQKKHICTDSSISCIKDSDCKVYMKDKCVNGSCSGIGWCGSDIGDYTLKYDIADNILMWVRSFIQFAQFESSQSIYIFVYSSSFYSNDPNYRSENINVFSINQLLRYSPDMISYPTLKETGGILKVSILWKCYIFSSCQPDIIVRRLDMQGNDALIGYSSVKYNFRKNSDGTLERTIHNMTGIKVIFSTEGIGIKISFQNIILQIAHFVSLMLIPKIIADFILIYILRYEDYASYKYENRLNRDKDEDSDNESLSPSPKKKNDSDEDEEEEEKKEDEDNNLLNSIETP